MTPSSVMITNWRYCLNAAMSTRWQYCLHAAMITRWHYCISVENKFTGCVHWIVNVSNCKKTLDCTKKTSTSPNRRERTLIRKTGCGTTEREERQMDRKREREGGRMQCFLKKENNRLRNVEHVETTDERCCHLS